MVNIFSPNALYGIDSFLVLLIIITTFSISYYSNKVYKIVKKRNYKIFSFAFLLLGFSYIFQIFSNIIIYYRVRVAPDIIFIITSHLPYAGLINTVFHFLYELFSITAFILLFFLISSKKRENLFIFIYLGIIVAIVSIYFPPIYHITLVVLLVFLGLHFFQNYERVKSMNSFFVFFAFLLLLISNLILTFSGLHVIFYIAGGFLTFVAYTLLLINQINIKNGTKKNETRGSKGHIRSS